MTDDKDKVQEKLEGAPPRGSRWRHYKGGFYRVITCSIEEDTLEPLVTYRSEEKGGVWTRTLENWLEEVTVDVGATDPARVGKKVPRFVPVPLPFEGQP